jgi:beta-phosphoglucomutase-like phosphatase (HAD superfamily)
MDAGRAGGFGYVVGVDRVGQADALHAHGADRVVADLAELAELADLADLDDLDDGD